MNDHTERRVDSESNAVNQAMSHLDRMDGEGAHPEAFAGANLAQIRVVEQFVLFQFVFDISKRELGAPHRHIEF